MKDRARAGRAFSRDGAAVHLGDPAGNGQAQSGTGSFAAASAVGPAKTLEDRIKIRFGDANAGVFDRDVCLVLNLAERDFAAAAGRSVLNGVVDQDQQQTANGDGIGADPDRSFWCKKCDRERFVGPENGTLLLRAADLVA